MNRCNFNDREGNNKLIKEKIVKDEEIIKWYWSCPKTDIDEKI